MLEVCVQSSEGARIAFHAGACRIELSESLEVGGITPASTLVSQVRREIPLPLIVLIRCRAGNFIYNDAEKKGMLDQCNDAIRMGADGIAVGGLTTNHALDIPFLGAVRQMFPDCCLVMHRAFDNVADPPLALEQLIDIGFQRILTSGGPQTAFEGIPHLRFLHEQSLDRIEILPAGGINPQNAKRILESTGVRQLHGSMCNQREDLSIPCAAWVTEIRNMFGP